MTDLVPLLRRAYPIIDNKNRLVFLWSAKAGCTLGVKWIFHQMGLLEEALAFHPWIHNYRENKYALSAEYRLGLERCCRENYRSIKLVRDPYARAVSSYCHALKFGYENKKIADFLSRPINAAHGFSFAEFIDYLANTGVLQCDIHHRRQVTELEESGRYAVTHIIKLENALVELGKLEQRYGLQAAPLAELTKSGHHLCRQPNNEFCGRTVFNGRENLFFDYQSYYDDALLDIVASVYRADFEYYNYSLSPAAADDTAS